MKACYKNQLKSRHVPHKNNIVMNKDRDLENNFHILNKNNQYVCIHLFSGFVYV